MFSFLLQGLPAAIASFAIAKNRYVAVSKEYIFMSIIKRLGFFLSQCWFNGLNCFRCQISKWFMFQLLQ